MRVVLHVHVDERQRRCRLLQHSPALEPVIGTLHLVGGNRRRIANDQTALAQIRDIERGDLGIFLGVIVDEVMHIGLFIGIDASHRFAYRTVKGGVVAASTRSDATSVPWKKPEQTTRHPFFSVSVIYGSVNGVASSSPRIIASNR